MTPGFSPASVEAEARTPTLAHEFLTRARWHLGDDRVAFGGFRIVGDSTTDWLLQHTLEGTRYDLGPLLRSEALATALPDLAQGVNPDRMYNFALVEPMALEASLASSLVGYPPGELSPRHTDPMQARGAASGLITALLGERLWLATILESPAAWSDWFACDVWDHTWVIVDAQRSLAWLLCLSSPPPPHLY